MFTNLQHESKFSFNFVALPVCQQQLLLLLLPSEELLLQEVELRPVVSCRDELSRVCLPACLEAWQDARLSSFCIIALVIVVLVDRLLRLLAPRLGLTQLPQGNSSNNSDKGRQQQQQQQQLRNVNKRTFQLCSRLLHFKGVCASLSQSLSFPLTIFSFTLSCCVPRPVQISPIVC